MQYVDDPEHLNFLGIYFANSKLSFFFCLAKAVQVLAQ